MSASPARECAYRVVRRVFEQDAYADRALQAEAAGLAPRERALATQLAFGTVQRCGTLDELIERLAGRRVRRLDPPVLAALRLGVFQVLFLEGVADHAAVNESVELAKGHAPRGAGLVNAVLRRATREGPGWLASLGEATPGEAAVKHSVPVWLAELWWRELGEETARALLAALNQPAETGLRLNPLAGQPPRLPVPADPAPGLPEGLILREPFDVHGSDLWRAGAIMAQSRASMAVSRILAPQSGQRVLDLCAAPGGKTSHLAALMENRGEVVAVERNPARARALRETLTRMKVGCATVQEADAAQGGWEGFDRVLVDPPCSGLGTLRSRPDRRWRATPEAVGELAALQAQILGAGARALSPGGVLVYSVCTISAAEGEEVVEQVLAEEPGLAVDDLAAEWPAWRHPRRDRFLQTLPHRDGTDGFFIARVHRPR